MANGDSPAGAVGVLQALAIDMIGHHGDLQMSCFQPRQGFSAWLLLPALIALSMPTPSQAQSLDQCMNANVNDALSLCQDILDSGSRNADVYWKLASALHQSERSTDALILLDRARSLHPSDVELALLEDVIESSGIEAQAIEKASRRNESRMQLALEKVTCLTREGAEGVSACSEYLAASNDDGSRVSERLTFLQNQQELASKPQREPDSDIQVILEPETKSLPSAADASTASETTTPLSPMASQNSGREDDGRADNSDMEAILSREPAIAERERAYRDRVREAQVLLTELGFQPGIADGLPGQRTRKALHDFYTRSAFPRRSDFSADTVVELAQARDDLTSARRLIREAQLAAGNKDVERARATTKQALSLSQLTVVPAELAALASEPAPINRQEIPPVSYSSSTIQQSTPRHTPDEEDQKTTALQLDRAFKQIRLLEVQLEQNSIEADRLIGNLRARTNAALGR